MPLLASPARFRLPPLPVTARRMQSGTSNSYIVTNRNDPTYTSIWPSDEVKNIIPLRGGSLWWYMSEDGVNDPVPSDYLSQSSNSSTSPPSSFSTAIVSQLNQQSSPQLTVFIHGLGNEWDDAINGTATLGANLAGVGYQGLVIGFDWPSYGEDTSALHYASGYRDAATSGTIRDNINGSVSAFGWFIDFIMGLRSSVANLKVNLVCHSEGNFMAMLGMAPINSILIDQVVLLAADINNGAFLASTGTYAGQAAQVATLSSRVTVYYTNADDTLALSQAGYQSLGYHNPAYGGRLGQTGPAYNLGEQQSNMCSVDCSEVLNVLTVQGNPNIPKGTTIHSSYFFVTQVLQDMAATLVDTAAGSVANRVATANDNAYLMSLATPS